VKPLREPFVEMDLNANNNATNDHESNPTNTNTNAGGAHAARATATSRSVPAVPAFGGSQSVVAETPSPIQVCLTYPRHTNHRPSSEDAHTHTRTAPRRHTPNVPHTPD